MKAKAKRAPALTVADAIKEALAWNRQDLRGIEDITPDAAMLEARAKVLRAALRRANAAEEAVFRLAYAYARGAEDNGGDSSVDWDDIDDAHGWADKALTREERADAVRRAREQNGHGEDD